MATASAPSLDLLYEQDETAWLEANADLIERGRWAEVDCHHLAEYLADMARRDRREVESRLTVLLAHLLKWEQQPQRRSGSWKATIIEQRQELEGLVSQGVLHNHAETVLTTMYHKAVERASAETGLAKESFPTACPYNLDQLLGEELPAD
jgi:hypothetical protein